MSNSATPWTAAYQAPLFSAITQSLLKFMSLESVMLSNHLILCHPLLLLSSIFPSIRVFSKVSVLCIRWPDWNFSFSISLCNESSRLISFRMDWFDFLAVQGTLKSLLRTTIWKHQFFGAQPSLWSNSHIHMTTGKTIALTTQTFIGKVVSLLLIHCLDLYKLFFQGASVF